MRTHVKSSPISYSAWTNTMRVVRLAVLPNGQMRFSPREGALGGWSWQPSSPPPADADGCGDAGGSLELAAGECWAGLWLMKLLILTHFLFSVELIVGWDLSYWCFAGPERAESFNNCIRRLLVFPASVCSICFREVFSLPSRSTFAHWFYRRPSFF